MLKLLFDTCLLDFSYFVLWIHLQPEKLSDKIKRERH